MARQDDLLEHGCVNINEAVRITGLGRSVLYQRMDAGEIRYVKVGRRRLVPRLALKAFLERHLVEAAEPESVAVLHPPARQLPQL